MLVYRVEDAGGMGMYVDMWKPCTDDEGFANDRHPSPLTCDILKQKIKEKSHLRELRDYHFGFTGKEQLHNWIYRKEWRDRMTEYGGVIKVYKVDKRLTLCSNEQVMFVKEKAKLVDELPVNFFDEKK